MRTVGLISLGCPKNLVDSEVMLGILENAGYSIVTDPSEAEVLIVNTCGFIEDAKKESVDAILEMAQYKSTGKCKKLVVTGCLPQRYKSGLAKLLPEVDLFIGAGEYYRIAEILKFSGKNLFVGTPRYIHTASTPRKIATPKHAIYIKIAEGCYHGCSFCVIPRIRGKFRSRTVDDVVKEAEQLIASGAKELNLIGQDTTSYGVDLKDGTNLVKLLYRLSELKGDFWIRVMYAYPTSITDELIEAIATLPKVCKYLDVPIQHISDSVLSLMKRKEKGSDVRALLAKIRARIPGITMRTSLIVGFPGETKKAFGELLEFVRQGHFEYLGVFAYSKEEGTVAARLPNQISDRVKMNRRDIIMKAQKPVTKKLLGRWVGSTLKTLIDNSHTICGRTEGQAPDIDGITCIRQKPKRKINVGDMVNVKIVDVADYDLIGRI